MSTPNKADMVSRALVALYPQGVPSEAVARLPAVQAYLAAAVDVLMGQRPTVPLARVASTGRGAKAKAAARVTQADLSDPSAHPFGLVPVRTIALVVGCDPHTVSAAMERHGIRQALSPRQCPTPDERWSALVEDWGAEKARQWFARYQLRPDARKQARAFDSWLKDKGLA